MTASGPHSPADEQDVMKQVYEWFERWQPTGKIADGGAELEPRNTAKTVRAGTDGQPMITDGPYLELKEVSQERRPLPRTVRQGRARQPVDLEAARISAAARPTTTIGPVSVALGGRWSRLW